MSQPIDYINKDIEIIKSSQIKILELKTAITQIKNSLEGLKSSFELAEERISKLEDR